MKIVRTINGRKIEIELTADEMFQAHTELVRSWDTEYVSRVIDDYLTENGITLNEPERKEACEFITDEMRMRVNKYDLEEEVAFDEAAAYYFANAAKRRLEKLKKQQLQYIAASGGVLALRESDDVYNDLNRKLIAAFAEVYSSARLGRVNFYGKQRQRFINGAESLYKPYTGQKICNFEFDFIVPSCDTELETMIRLWNEGVGALVPKITARIEELGGINFIWY